MLSRAGPSARIGVAGSARAAATTPAASHGLRYRQPDIVDFVVMRICSSYLTVASKCERGAKECRTLGQLRAKGLWRRNFDVIWGRPFAELSHSRFKGGLAKTPKEARHW